MKKIITTLAISFASIFAFAQQDAQFTQFMYNKLFMNPAFAGMREAYCFTAIARQQWAGFDGSPRSGNFSGDMWLPNVGRNGSGVGVNFLYDQLGFEKNTSFKINYSYHQNLGPGVLAIGIEAGIFSKQIGPTGNDQWLASSNWQADPTIPTQLSKKIADMGAGLWYQTKNIWFGISSTHLNGKLIDGQDELLGTVIHPVLYQMARHYFVTGGINLSPTPSWQIRPSFLVKTDGTITTVDLNVNALFNDQFWFGCSYRFKDAICPMIGFQIPSVKTNPNGFADGGMKIGFAYDYTTSNLKNYSNGTFELFVNYCIPIKQKPNSFEVNSERFFK